MKLTHEEYLKAVELEKKQFGNIDIEIGKQIPGHDELFNYEMAKTYVCSSVLNISGFQPCPFCESKGRINFNTSRNGSVVDTVGKCTTPNCFSWKGQYNDI